MMTTITAVAVLFSCFMEYRYRKVLKQANKDRALAEKAVDLRLWLDNAHGAYSMLDRAEALVGNPGANISGSADMAAAAWQRDYEAWKQYRFSTSWHNTEP